jgi:protein-S-isoprenylcysteine O-methyltransferase Ste14
LLGRFLGRLGDPRADVPKQRPQRRDSRCAAFGCCSRVAIFLAIGYGNTLNLRPFGELALDVAAAGAALCIVGLAFAIWARVSLGRNWGMPMTQHENPELVTSGPYRLVRHPIYTGMSSMLIGTALVYPLAALPCLGMVGYTVYSALREERDMEQRFPGSYAEYKKRSKMLVPFLL